MNRIASIFVLLTFLCIASAAQHECPVAPPIRRVSGNIFTAQQEVELGDIVAERQEHDFQVIYDDALNNRLQATGDRIVNVFTHASHA